MNSPGPRSQTGRRTGSESRRQGSSAPAPAPWPKTLRAADEFYVLAHDHRTGRPLLHDRPLGLGTAGALLSELVLADLVHMRADAPVVVAGGVADEPLAAQLLSLLATQESAPLREWLAFLAPRCVEAVGDRLVRQRLFVAERQPRRAGRSRGVAVRPGNPNAAYWRPVRLARLLADPHPDPTLMATASASDVVVAGLVNATSLLHTVIDTGLPGADTSLAQRRLDHALANSSRDLAAVVAAVQLSVGDAFLSART